jgi:hypothetical protein
MYPADADVARIRAVNDRVPRTEFVAVWREASRRGPEPGDSSPTDWYASAVALTCRWIAAVPMRTALCGGLPRSPVTERACLADEGSIEVEWSAAQRLEESEPELAAARPGWCDGVRDTLRWAGRGEGPAPIEGARR